ncbi:MAG: hypothetical protein AB8H80_06910 [Planctomycetota bacterium]
MSISRWRSCSVAIGATALLTLPACGTNLLVLQQHAAVFVDRSRSESGNDGDRDNGEQHWFVLETRPEHGLLQPHYDAPLSVWATESLVAVLLEPVDLFASTGAAIAAMFDDKACVQGGVVGWLWAMTPFATLVPPPLQKIPYHASAEEWADLTSDNRERRAFAANRIWPHDNVIDVRLLKPGLPEPDGGR